MPLEPGARLGDYDVLDRLGSGGMGEVWLARDQHLQRRVALKVLPLELNTDPARVARFQQEARLASALNHPNVCTIHALGELPDGRQFIAMELIEGKTLRVELAHRKAGIRFAVDVAIQVASALAAAHARGIVHRDVKPENVMVRPDGVVKVLDFGLAKLDPLGAGRRTDSTHSALGTDAGKVVGTVMYMSPEQARGQYVDARTDVWSLGVVLYEMVTGHAPFDGPSSTDVLAAILNHEPDVLARFEPQVPAELHRIVTKALRKDCGHRYQSMQDLLLDLQALAGSQHDSAGAPAQKRAGGRRAGWVLAAVGVAALTLFATSTWRTGPSGGMAPRSVRSLAVLPLENLSRDPSQEYFADGMTDELITALGHIGSLKVISRTSVMRYRGSNKTARVIAKELGVDAILQGTVLRSGDRIRISAQLTDGETDHNLWGRSYERGLEDVLRLQDEVARAIAGEIQGTLPDAPGSDRKRRIDPTAHEAYLKGRFQLSKWTADGYQKASQYFQEAIAADPEYPDAYAGLADSYALLGYYGMVAPKEAYPRAKAAALKALALNDSLSEAHTSLALITDNFEWDWNRGEQKFKRALELNPSSAMAHLWYSYHLVWTDRFEEAIDEARRAEELDPLSLVASTSTANIFYDAKRFDRAIAQCRTVLDMDPEFRWAHHSLGEALVETGKLEEGVKELALGLDPERRNPHFKAKLAYGLALSGDRKGALAIVRELEEDSRVRYVPPFQIAVVHAGLGDKRQALFWLEKAYEVRDTWLSSIKADNGLHSLKGDRQYRDLVMRVGLRPPD